MHRDGQMVIHHRSTGTCLWQNSSSLRKPQTNVATSSTSPIISQTFRSSYGMCAPPFSTNSTDHSEYKHRPLSDNVNARSILMNDCYIPRTGANADKSFLGVQAPHGDAERLRGWDLITHGGFLTYPHHDAAGLCTYVTCRSGTKIWGYIDPPSNWGMKRNDLFRMWDALFDKFATSPARFPIGSLLLEPGDTLLSDFICISCDQF